MKRSSMVLLALALALVAGAAAWMLRGPGRRLPEALLQGVPADTPAFVHVRVREVLTSRAFQRLVVERGHARGMQRITQRCGFNPLEQVRELVAYAVPAGHALPDVALMARGRFEPTALADCVKAVSGRGRDGLSYREVDGFHEVCSSGGRTCVDLAGREGLFGGPAAHLPAVRDVLAGRAPNVLAREALARLWRDVEGADVGLVAIVPDEARERLRRLYPALTARLGPLLQAQTLSAALHLEPALRGTLRVALPSAAQAAKAAALVQRQVTQLQRIPGLSATPLAQVLRAASVRAEGERAVFEGTLTLAQAGTLLDLLPAARALLDQTPRAPRTPDAGATPSPPP